MTAPGTQLLVYQMQYSAATPTAMILPLPVTTPASEASVSWKSLKDHPHFFDNFALGFPAEHVADLTKGAVAASAEPTIEVHEVGDFIASFVPTMDDFSRVDPRFAISKSTWSAIPEYRDYGFAVFQLKELSGSPHPIALELKTRMRDSIYYPTVHIHDGTVHKEDSFDHVLYLQDATLDAKVGAYAGPYTPDSVTGFVRSKGALASFSEDAGVADGKLLLHKRLMFGSLPNKDTIVSLAAISRASAGCSRCDVGIGMDGREVTLGPAALAAAGLAWIIRRRNARNRVT
jgi:hypothetical protein